MTVKRLSIERIRRDFQPPENLIDLKIDELIAAMRRGEKLPPIRVYYDGRTYWLADGFHRIAASLRRGRRTISAEIVPGTFAELQAEWKRYDQELLRQLRGERRQSRKE
jgi:ParB-like chromosome segregation protein Spo0J